MATSTIWRLPDVLHHTGLSRSTIYDMIGRGDFPQQVQLGRRAVGWMSQEVIDWIDARVACPSSVEVTKTLESPRNRPFR